MFRKAALDRCDFSSASDFERPGRGGGLWPVPCVDNHGPLLVLVLVALCLEPLSRLTMGLLGHVIEEAVLELECLPAGLVRPVLNRDSHESVPQWTASPQAPCCVQSSLALGPLTCRYPGSG